MEKSSDRVPRDVVYWSFIKKEVTEKMVRLVKSMYEVARTSMRCSIGNTGKFEIRVGVHLCCLS